MGKCAGLQSEWECAQQNSFRMGQCVQLAAALVESREWREWDDEWHANGTLDGT